MSKVAESRGLQSAQYFSLLESYVRRASDFTITLWLFNVNDIKTMVVPSTAFALSTTIFILRHNASYIGTQSISYSLASRLPLILTWTWINLLAFTVANQRTTESIKEDCLNKPWRPIPSGRITQEAARKLSLCSYAVAILTSCALGGLLPSILLILFGLWYNDLGGGDGHWLIRNMINGCGFTSFAAGALEVALQSSSIGRNITVPWLCIIAFVVCTTVHSQDMYDQAGDAAAGRHTLPLVIGDVPARWTIAGAVLLWTALCPAFWSVSVVGYSMAAIPGIGVAIRTLRNRSVKDDRVTFKLYNVWLMSLYALPLVK